MLNSEQLIAAYNTFRNKWSSLPDKDCEELFYTKLGIPIPEDLHLWEEFKKTHSHPHFNEEELKILFNLPNISDNVNCIRDLMANISKQQTELGGNMFALKYILTSVDIVEKKKYDTYVATIFKYILEGPTSAVDPRTIRYIYIFQYKEDLCYIGLPDGNW